MKRVFDFAFSAAVLVLLSWLFVIIAILVKVDDPKGPVFFKQTRVGKNGREFEMLKFRSMCVDAEEKLADLKELNEKTGPVFKIAEDPRITRLGKWLRKLSLDELPQFINVLRSDMSVVGPRPALPNEVATYNDYQRQRLLVKPGMTCYWQTRRNRDSITFDEWVDLDLWKVAPRSLGASSTTSPLVVTSFLLQWPERYASRAAVLSWRFAPTISSASSSSRALSVSCMVFLTSSRRSDLNDSSSTDAMSADVVAMPSSVRFMLGR